MQWPFIDCPTLYMIMMEKILSYIYFFRNSKNVLNVSDKNKWMVHK